MDSHAQTHTPGHHSLAPPPATSGGNNLLVHPTFVVISFFFKLGLAWWLHLYFFILL